MQRTGNVIGIADMHILFRMPTNPETICLYRSGGSGRIQVKLVELVEVNEVVAVVAVVGLVGLVAVVE